jgi:uncharacterized membrane protein YeaQ/YmgE (transglycosylase-associated protein family)
MVFVIGILIWLVMAVIAGALVRALYGAPGTSSALSFTFAIFGGLIGGLLGVAPYVYHDPYPTRVGALIGAAVGAMFFTWMYHFIARKAV